MQARKPLLVHYQDLSRLTDAMLDCTREERWDDLEQLEQKRTGIVDLLRKSAPLADQPPEVIGQCETLIKQVLARQEEILRAVENWRGELGVTLKSFETGRKLSRMYQSQG